MSGVERTRMSVNGHSKDKKIGHTPHISEVIYQLLEILFIIIVWTVQTIYYIGECLYRKFVPLQPESVEGEIVLITGTGHGIGRELAFKYAEAGATVVGWDINKENNDQTIKEINGRCKNKAKGFVCNVAKREDVLEVAKKVRNEVGEVSIVIANAGIMPCRPLESQTPLMIQQVMDINVMQLFWLLEAFLPSMKENNHGHIVGISSIAGLGGFANVVPYCATKFAVRGLLEALREELRKDIKNKIRVTTGYPYMVNTGLCKNPKIKFDSFMKMIPPEDVAEGLMQAQRTGQLEVSFPSYLLNFQSFLRILPGKSVMKAVDLLESGLESDLLLENSSE